MTSRTSTQTAAPEVPQHLRALALANQRRLARNAIRQRIAGLPPHEALRELARIVEHPPPECASVTAHELLTWPHRWHAKRAARFLASLALDDQERILAKPGDQAAAKGVVALSPLRRAGLAATLRFEAAALDGGLSQHARQEPAR